MLARNSIGRRVSLLNDESSNSRTGADGRSSSLSSLPSISSFYNGSLSPRISNKCQDSTRTRSYLNSSNNNSPNNSPIRSSDYSPTLSNCSTEVEASTANAQYSPEYYKHNNNTKSLPIHSIIRQRPAGPTPLLRVDDCEKPIATLRRDTSTSSNASSGSTTSSSSSSSLLLSSSTSCSSLSSSSTHHNIHSPNSINDNNNNNNKRPSLLTFHSIDSNHSSASSSTTSTSNHTPLTPPTPASNYNTSTRSIPTINTSVRKMMDPHSKTMYPTMLASPTNDNFLYNSHAMNSLNQRNPLSGQYFSVAQQPLPAVSSTSPIMYSTLESPNSLVMMDQYLPLQQSQHSPISAIPYSPYPTELLPGAMSLQHPTPGQSIAATSPSDTSNNSTAGQPKTAKKKYPCPHAAKYNCPDTFTTSGHAARHGKKHTGEKNIHCPVCNKAFTRKDNMKQHERTHRNKGEASKVAEAVESSKRSAAQHRSTLSKSSTNSSAEVEMEDISPPPKRLSDPHATIRAANQQRRPNISSVQQVVPPSLTSPTAADIPMPVSLDSGETLQQVAPSLHVDTLDKSFTNIFDHSFNSRSQETLLGRPPIFERTTSTGSGFSGDGGGESPGLDALAMAAELS